MRDFTNIIGHSLLRLATIFTTLLVGMTFALITSTASAGEIKKVEIVKPKVVEIVKPEVKKVEVKEIKAVKPEANSRVVRPFGVRPFFVRPFFNPFFNEEID